jgi:hypothetical protein
MIFAEITPGILLNQPFALSLSKGEALNCARASARIFSLEASPFDRLRANGFRTKTWLQKPGKSQLTTQGAT